jgi:dextranase
LLITPLLFFGEEVSITKAPVDFLYTEVWPPDEAYNDLKTIIQNNDAWSNNTKKTVLAAYAGSII